MHCEMRLGKRSNYVQERPALWNAILEPEDAEDDVEHFIDQPDPDVPNDSPSNSKGQSASVAAASRGKKDYEGEGDDLGTDDLQAAGTSQNGYDMLKRWAACRKQEIYMRLSMAQSLYVRTALRQV